ncbi:hypothetical protein NHQ30_010471 [Ciborinia camelliae]|nr:hypothetical protein NHQ30_010471 [Ciborinia camelliae]
MSFFLQNPNLRNLYQDIQPHLNGLDPFSLTDEELIDLKESRIDEELERDIRRWVQRRSDILWEETMKENAGRGPETTRMVNKRRKETQMLEKLRLSHLERVLYWPYCFDDSERALAVDDDIEIDHENRQLILVQEEERYEVIHHEMKRLHEDGTTRRNVNDNSSPAFTSLGPGKDLKFPKGWWKCIQTTESRLWAYEMRE